MQSYYKKQKSTNVYLRIGLPDSIKKFLGTVNITFCVQIAKQIEEIVSRLFESAEVIRFSISNFV